MVVSPRLNNIFTLGYPVAWEPTHGGLIWRAGPLHPSLGCPTHSCCPETVAGGRSQPRERFKRTCLRLAPSSLEQQLMALWAVLWAGAGRDARVLALRTSPEQPVPIFSRGKRHQARQKPPAGWVWPADRPQLGSAELAHPCCNCAENYLLVQDLYILISMV